MRELRKPCEVQAQRRKIYSAALVAALFGALTMLFLNA